MKFAEGDEVLARLPGSEDFEKAKIINVTGNKYKILFKAGEKHTLGESEVKAPRTSRSQTRTRGRGGKSPGRKSPARRSPARKSPVRSPNLSRKLPVRSARQAKISLARLDFPKDNSSDTDRTEESGSVQDDYDPPAQSRLRELGPITRRSIRIMSNASKAQQEQKLLMLNRGPDRAASLPVERKYSSGAEGKERFSVQRDEDLSKSKRYEEDTDAGSNEKSKDIEMISIPQEWGGWYGALMLILLLTVGNLFLQIACSNDHCSYNNFRFPRYKEWKLFFNFDAFLLYTGYIFFIAVTCVLPIGRVVDGQQSKAGRLQYRINGIWTLFICVAALGVCTYQGYNIGDFLLKKSLPLTVVGVGYGILLAIILYIKGGKVPVANLNMYGSTHNIIYDFWAGREVCPRFGPLDIKSFLFRTSTTAVVIINLAAIIKIVKGAESLDLNNLNLAAILVACLQIFYVLDIFLFEAGTVTTFETAYEGAGYMVTVGHLVYPYFQTVTTRYLLVHRVQHSVYFMAFYTFCVCIFFVGYIIYRKSNSIKDEFRKNPFSPSVSHLETIPTKRGKRLIVSGLWGSVRHPNYSGDILMHLSIALLSLDISHKDILPFVPFMQITLLLIHRAIRDNARCQKRYGYAWEQYCSRVKYMLVKGVF